MADLPDEMKDRYGLNRSPAKIVGYLLVAFAVVIAAVAIAMQFIGRGPTIELHNTGHTVQSNSEVRITYTVHGEAGVELECSATAVNDNFAEVGAKEWTWTMEKDTETRALTLATSERAASGSIEYCSRVP